MPRSHRLPGNSHPSGKATAELAATAEGHTQIGTVRRAVRVDTTVKSANLARLKRIEGQVRGLQRMVEEERYCADILTQLSSVQEALRGVARELMRNHLKHCATTAIKEGHGRAEAMYDELVEMMHKYAR